MIRLIGALPLTCAGALMAACTYYETEASEDVTPPSGTSADGGAVANGELPCDVAELLSSNCWSCHGSQPRNGAPMSLATRAALQAASTVSPGMTQAERALARMRDTQRPMPPAGRTPPSADAVAKFAAWIEQGMPMGMCGGAGGSGDAGSDDMGVDGGTTAQLTCSSGEFWPIDWDDGSPNMNPGLPCRSCHLQQEDRRAYFFMGTVYPTLHERDRCISSVLAGTEVHIVDRDGQVALRLPVRAGGNFFSTEREAGVRLPFTARVVGPRGETISMSTPQMSGDCNGCHTERGANGAPGRILLPTP